MITEYFNYANAARHFEAQFFPCRTNELDAVNRLNERTRACHAVKQLLKKTGDKVFAWTEDRFTN